MYTKSLPIQGLKDPVEDFVYGFKGAENIAKVVLQRILGLLESGKTIQQKISGMKFASKKILKV